MDFTRLDFAQGQSKERKISIRTDRSQSDTTFIDQSLITEMNISPTSREATRLKVSTLTSDNGHKESIICERASGLQVKGYNHHIYVNLPSSYTIDHISLNQETIPRCDIAKHHLQAVAKELPPLLNCEPGILIGFDCSHAFLPRECIARNNAEPFALQTDLGWSIIGSTQSSNMSSQRSLCHRIITREVPLASPRDAVAVLERDFENDSHDDKTVSLEDIQFLNILEGNIRKEEGQYKMPLPFNGIPKMPNNHCIALKRLNHLKQKLAKNKELRIEYCQFMDEMIQRGDAERVPTPKPGQEWYIPRHGVFHPRKGKLRVVFDCSAKFQNTCLNDHLLVGPNLINSLAGVLYRFRQHQIAVICDIEKLFHQFKVDDNHRDFLRFLWWENGDINNEPTTYRMTAHLFGAASSPGCANFGLKYLARECQEEYPIGAKFIKEDFYVDDGLSSQENERKAIGLIEEAVNICRKGGLRLHKFASNSSKVMNQISPLETAANHQTLNLSFEDLPMERALGLQWSIQNDTFHFFFNPVEKPTTRRGILSTVPSLYEPLGLIAPFVLTGKRILQDTCHKSTKWDEPIPEELRAPWNSWKNDFVILQSLTIPRYYFPVPYSLVTKTQLHHFSDASLKGHGMCTYLRVETNDGRVFCSLVVAKFRVSPRKPISIPRLELTAALVSAEIGNSVKQELSLKIDEEVYWTDSQVVIGYINNEARRFHTFVANRVQRIRNLTNPGQWHHISTESNPADKASRGLTATEILHSNWLTGPQFLKDSGFTLPAEPIPSVREGDPEVKAVSFKTQIKHQICDLDSRLTHFSKWKQVAPRSRESNKCS